MGKVKLPQTIGGQSVIIHFLNNMFLRPNFTCSPSPKGSSAQLPTPLEIALSEPSHI